MRIYETCKNNIWKWALNFAVAIVFALQSDAWVHLVAVVFGMAAGGVLRGGAARIRGVRTMIDLDELAALALTRTQGEWASVNHDGLGGDSSIRLANDGMIIAQTERYTDARAIAAAINAIGLLVKIARTAKVLQHCIPEVISYEEGEAYDALDAALREIK